MPPLPLEEVHWINKGSAPFLGGSINGTGPYPKDTNGNRFLLVAVDPFSKWVEACPVPSLRSWHAAKFLEDIMHQWGKQGMCGRTMGQSSRGALHAYTRYLALCTKSR